ncbi:ferritin-like domain-containing protein [Foetidibacter luteolus]|uniref:ferritin-like domain-containing protein n=1 Tax=Foetidibacter luteolus TaxID=2608880 RepID=UPI00129AD221|nr:ferritin-like domain-containing protein [Foetidibacter luteolus]
MLNTNMPGTAIDSGEKRQQHSRRKFLTMAGTAGLLTAGLASCQKIGQWFPIPGKDPGDNDVVDLGSGDIGILNYAYTLEQLEAAFYTLVCSNPFNGCTAYERKLFQDIRDHEIAHREFFKNALGSNAIPSLKLDFSSVNFLNRSSVLATAKAFEDLGVSAYNGAGSLIASGDYLLLAGKIVSVEARHAAYIRDLIDYGSFADSTVVDNNGLDTSRKPAEVLPIAKTYIRTKLDASHLPS